jgi:hypothetical protein
LVVVGVISMLKITNIRATERTNRRATTFACATRLDDSFWSSRISVVKRVSNIWNRNTNIQLIIRTVLLFTYLLLLCTQAVPISSRYKYNPKGSSKSFMLDFHVSNYIQTFYAYLEPCSTCTKYAIPVCMYAWLVYGFLCYLILEILIKFVDTFQSWQRSEKHNRDFK